PPAELRCAACGRLEVLARGHQMYPLQDLEIRLQPPRGAPLDAALAERRREERIELGREDQGGPRRDTRRQAVRLSQRRRSGIEGGVGASGECAHPNGDARGKGRLEMPGESTLAERVRSNRIVP